jgi:hypothetical protein
MAEPLDDPQEIEPNYDEEGLRQLSLTQNGVAGIRRIQGSSGEITGFLSLYPLDLKGYKPPSAQSGPTQIPFLGFLALFTQAEQTAIVGSDDVRVRLFCLMAAGANFVDLTDPRVIQGAQLLETLGLIKKGRAASVLAGQSPSAS